LTEDYKYDNDDNCDLLIYVLLYNVTVAQIYTQSNSNFELLA